MNLNQLTTFVTVISEGSMTAAADKLYLTQPAVSQQIRNLEEELGVELLARGVRQIKPTIHGEILYDHARKILQLSVQAENAIKSVGAELKGHLKIGTLNSLGLHVMSPVISRLMRYNPDLMLRVEYEKGDPLLKAFKKNQLDVLILPEIQTQFSAESDPQFEAKFLLREEMWLVGSGRDTEIPPQIEVDQLNLFPTAYLVEEYPHFNKTLQSRLDEKKVIVRPVFETSNVGTLKRVIESGLGWGFLPAHSIKKQVRSGRLSRTHVSGMDYSMDLFFYYRKGSESKTLIETFYQALASQEK